MPEGIFPPSAVLQGQKKSLSWARSDVSGATPPFWPAFIGEFRAIPPGLKNMPSPGPTPVALAPDAPSHLSSVWGREELFVRTVVLDLVRNLA